ncbi:uncharacterized protein LOC128893723 [Hylaeus anthracinus]|uniref:uncharacterized protein LOC128893723 n=1 Tax=Hylaeus anthracinus TaxID=313031 RepID=UPI0023B8B13A|nr:uncharacterized protein LOC128893723 [Hylaeus anthracinus]
MAAFNMFSNIEKLTEHNYDLWKVQIKSILIYNDLWQYVVGSEVKPEENPQEWIKKDGKALALINLSVTHSQLLHIKKANTSKEAWDKLKIIFESRGPVRKATLCKELLQMESKPGTTIVQYLNEFSEIADQVKEAGIEISDELLSIMLLISLPRKFENFSIAIESRDDIPTLDNLTAKIKEEEARQNERDIKSGESEKKSDALHVKDNFDKKKYSLQLRTIRT